MTPNRWALASGLALLTVGVPWLLRNLGLLPGALELGPLVLIAAGVLLLVGGVSPGQRGHGQPHQAQSGTTTTSMPLGGAASARVKLHYGAGTLRVAAGAGPGLLYEGTFAGGIRHEAQLRGTQLDVRVRHASDAASATGWSRPLDWDLRLSAGVPLDLEISTGASRVDLDLSALDVRSLKIETGASDVAIVVPSRGDCRLEIEAAAADVRVRVPDGVAARVRTRSALASIDIDRIRFPQVDGVHRSADFETASNRVDIDIEGGLAAFAVR